MKRTSVVVVARPLVAALALMWTPLALIGNAHASPSARLVYSRSADATSCPDEASLRQAVAKRFGYDPFFPWAKQAIVVQVWRERGRPRARVELVDAGGVGRGTRELNSDQEDCAELFDATALAISIALDLLEPPAQPKPTDAVIPEPQPAVVPSKPAPLMSPPPPPPLPTPEPPEPPRPESSALRFSLGADVAINGNTAPGLAPGLGVFVSGRRGLLSLGIEVRSDLAVPAALGLHGERVDVLVVAGVLAPCIHLGPAFLCPLGEFGTLTAWGLDAGAAPPQGTTFLAAGGRAGVQWALSPSWALRARGDVLANLNRQGLQGSIDYWPANTWFYAAALGVLTTFR